MMKINKENWEYKSFLSCIEKVPKPKQLTTSDYKKSGAIPIVSQDAKLITGYTNHEELKNKFDKPVIVFGDHTRVLKYIDFDFVVGADGVKIIIPKGNLLTKFLYYFLVWHKILNLGYARHFKLLKDIMIPIPPINTQNYFISLFDKYQDLIFLKQKQLKEFDSLESSVFIKMFGDSVVKEMGWEVKSLGEIGNIITGSTPSTKDKENYEPKEYCFVKPSDLPSKGVANITTTEYFVSSKGFALSRALPIGSVLISCIGTIGKIGILKQVACSNQQINAIIPNRTIDSYYLAYNIAVNKNKLESMANAPVVPIINKTSFSLFKIAIPPLSLQQSFAQKIEVIEKQKEVVKNEIAQLQALLDSEMDKYFG